MAWFGDKDGHAKAGRKGGQASRKNWRDNPGNFANNKDLARRAGAKGGSAINKQHKAITKAKNKGV